MSVDYSKTYPLKRLASRGIQPQDLKEDTKLFPRVEIRELRLSCEATLHDRVARRYELIPD
jgi:hypothetical protein